MKQLVCIGLILVVSSLVAQDPQGFDMLIQVESTPLKDQQSTGTCWSFATTSFIETEALRLGHQPVSLSPIFYVAPTYVAKSEKFIETGGKTYYESGDLTFSVLSAYTQYGAIPESVYKGMVEGDWQHDHLEMDNLLKAMVVSIGTSGYGRIKPNSWRQSIEGVLASYLGTPPAVFTYEGESYTPLSFAEAHVGIDPKDYVEITSYTHLPFYQQSVLNIPANWNGNLYLNLPLADFERVLEHALAHGYSLAWDGDATERRFKFDQGILMLPARQENTNITQRLRQKTFEDQSTTDDHNMHLVGKARDPKGKVFYVFKNSEGENRTGGYVYMSKNALLLKTISLLVHKEAIPSDILEQCTFHTY